jgi:hypothetical protein
VNAEVLLRELRRRGAHLWVEGDRVCWRAPKGLVTPRVCEAMRQLKAGLILLLESERLLQERGCIRCGRVPLRKAGQVCFWCQEGARGVGSGTGAGRTSFTIAPGSRLSGWEERKRPQTKRFTPAAPLLWRQVAFRANEWNASVLTARGRSPSRSARAARWAPDPKRECR